MLYLYRVSCADPAHSTRRGEPGWSDRAKLPVTLRSDRALSRDEQRRAGAGYVCEACGRHVVQGTSAARHALHAALAGHATVVDPLAPDGRVPRSELLAALRHLDGDSR